MDVLRSIYPPLGQREPLPALYVPSGYALLALTVFIPGKISRVFITFPILLLLALGTPFYTSGNVSEDYGVGVTFLALTLAYIDFFILCPLERKPVRYTGSLNPSKKDTGISEDDCATAWEKFKWSLRFVTMARAIGWNVQVKRIPKHPDAGLARWDFVRKSVLKAAVSQARKLFSVYLIGFAITAKGSGASPFTPWELDIVIGWAGGSWGYNGLDVLYNIGAAGTVALGLCEPWEWPPLFGPLSEAWSVRQMWSFVWHQMIRRKLQQPGIRLVRLLGIRKGTLGSKYLQLYVAFAITLLLHEWQMFNTVRRDMGEFRFFIVQPLAITAEDLVQWSWRRYLRPYGSPKVMDFVGKAVGYVWTFAWFSFCLPQFIPGLLHIGMLGGGYAEPWAIDLGRQTAFSWLK